MKTGSRVRVVQPPPPEGVVLQRRIQPEGDEIEYLVEWHDANGDTVQRWFGAAQIEEVTP